VTVTGNALPDFNALGVTFSDARDKLRSLGLGVQLYFNDAGQGATVDYTVPAAGTVVKRGTTIKIYVTGPAPLLSVPDVTGERCGQGGKDLAAAGLIPSYPDGKEGNVMSTEPNATDSQTHWNDPVTVHCGTGPITNPSDGPTTQPPDGGDPSASQSP
jgi:beta-lactam-binding protein with PASTA domain